MSAHRASNLIKTVNEKGFPKNVHIVQEMLNSADLTPKVEIMTPNMKPVKNTAQSHEIFEVHWSANCA